MCPKGALLRSKGDETATCPGGHTGCIANVNKLESLSEYESRCEIEREHYWCWFYWCILHTRWRLAFVQGCREIHAGSHPIKPNETSGWLVTPLTDKSQTSKEKNFQPRPLSRDDKEERQRGMSVCSGSTSPRAHLHVVGMLRFMSDINQPAYQLFFLFFFFFF